MLGTIITVIIYALIVVAFCKVFFVKPQHQEVEVNEEDDDGNYFTHTEFDLNTIKEMYEK